MGKACLSRCNHRASEWYEKNELIAGAVSHALAAEDVERAARLVEGNTLAMMDYGDLKTLVRQLGVALLDSGDLTAAALAYTKAVAISQAAGDSHVSVMALCRLAAGQGRR